MNDARMPQALKTTSRRVVRGFLAWDQTPQLWKKAEKKFSERNEPSGGLGEKRVAPRILTPFHFAFAIFSPQRCLVPGLRTLRPSWVQVS